MHPFKTFSRLILVVSLFTSALSAPVFTAARQANAPAAPQTVTLPGLKSSVTVRRDERGIPYIEAANEEDLYFAQGYVTASDRLWQMDLLRRTARGELSEIFGRAALEEDKRRRIYGFASIAEGLVAQASPPVRAALEAYARGVNAYINSLDASTLPLEFQLGQYRPRPWTAADSAAVGKNFAEALSTTWQLDLARALFADLPPEKREQLFPTTSPLDVLVVGQDRPQPKQQRQSQRSRAGNAQPFADPDGTLRALAETEATTRRSLERVGLFAEDLAASNNWVVNGKHTLSGKPLLANDPHLPPSAPSIWYMMHLSAPGLRVAGVTSPGAPGIIIGHNDRIAWGLTNLGPDVQDLYVEKFDPENPRRYMTPEGWREAVVRREEIKVRKNLTETATETVPLDVTVTRHGPIIFEREGRRYALRWTALDPNAVDFEGLHYINRARNWREFRDGLRSYRGPTQNFVYADVDGHIGYYGAGLVPMRKSGDGSTPYDGSTDAGEWTGYIPFEELPQSFDPPTGIIVTANSRVVGTSYPHFLTNNWAPPTRARRIYQMLSERKRMTAEDFRAIQGDAHSISGGIFAREVVKIAREAGLDAKDEQWRMTLQLFSAWDGELLAESRAAKLAAEMRNIFQLKILEPALGAARAREYRWGSSVTFFDRVISERPAEWLPSGVKSYAELLDAVHREARASLAKRLGADETQWTWGREAIARFNHPIAGIPVIGQAFVIEPFPQKGGGGVFAVPNVGSGVSMRLIADTSNWDLTQQGIALGESGNPRSPHWKDQLADWRAVTPRAFPFTAAAVARAGKQTLTLAPATR